METNRTEKSHKGIIIAILLSLLWMVVTAILGTLGYFEYQRVAFHLLIIMTVAAPTIIF